MDEDDKIYLFVDETACRAALGPSVSVILYILVTGESIESVSSQAMFLHESVPVIKVFPPGLE